MYTYILIDDEELIRKGTLKKISPLNDLVTCIGEADNGQSGIDLIAKAKPDFVILDMQMPVMDGMKLLPYLAGHYPELPLIVISGYRNFDYIKQAISSNAVEYLLKPFSSEMIQDSIRQVISRLEKRNSISRQLQLTEEETEAARYDYDITLLRNLIFGYHADTTTVTSKQLNYVNSTHDLALLTIVFSESGDEKEFKDWALENSFGNLAIYIMGRHEDRQGFVILFLPPQSLPFQKRLIHQVADSCLKTGVAAKTGFMIGISSIHHSLEELGSAYAETSRALDQRPIDDHSGSLYLYDEDKEAKNLIWERSEEFLFRIEAGMTEEVSVLCEELFAFYHSVPDCRLADVKRHCEHLGSRCRQLLNEYMRTPDRTSESETMQNVASHLFSVKELEAYYRQFFLNVTIMLKPHSIYRNEDVVENIKTYIQKNYQKDLSQEYLSSLFYLNRSYLSSLFKSRTGEKFVDYLNDVRIGHAEELLQNPGQRLNQIAKAVGYDNPKYFFRIFKKRTGMTPEQYRKELGQ